MSAEGRSTAHLWLGTLLFVAILPGTAIVYVPYWITGWELGPPLLGLSALRWLGVALIVAGAPVFGDFLWRFVQQGHGTPAPVAPPSELVVGGTFRWVRNPGYVAVLALVVGQALLFGSWGALLWAGALWLVFHLFVVFYEEPELRRQFGEEYEAYCRGVRRWLPRPPGGRQP